MAALATNKSRNVTVGVHDEQPALAATRIFQGSAVELNSASGYAKPLASATANFAGFALDEADNRVDIVGDGTNAAINVSLAATGRVRLTVTGVSAATDVGSTVYASTDNDFTLTSTGNNAIGKVLRWISGSDADVAFEATSMRSI